MSEICKHILEIDEKGRFAYCLKCNEEWSLENVLLAFASVRDERDALRAENERLKEKAEVYAGAKEVIDELRTENERLRRTNESLKNFGLCVEADKFAAELKMKAMQGVVDAARELRIVQHAKKQHKQNKEECGFCSDNLSEFCPSMEALFNEEREAIAKIEGALFEYDALNGEEE